MAVKMTVAASLGWWLAGFAGTSRPIFAALVGVTAMSSDPFGSFGATLARTHGVFAGVGIGRGGGSAKPSTVRGRFGSAARSLDGAAALVVRTELRQVLADLGLALQATRGHLLIQRMETVPQSLLRFEAAFRCDDGAWRIASLHVEAFGGEGS